MTNPCTIFRRRSPSRAWPLLFILSTALNLALGDESSGEEATKGNAWQPTLALGFDIHSQGLDGNSEIPPLFLEDPGPPVVPESGWFTIAQGEPGKLQNIFFDAKVGLYAPPFYEEGLTPRLFIYAGGQLPFTDTYTSNRYNRAYAERQTIGPSGMPGPEGQARCGGFQTIQNQTLPALTSCAVTAKDTLTLDGTWYAGLGVEVTLPFRNRSFHLRPSLGYMGQSYTVVGSVETFEFLRNVSVFVEESVAGSSDRKIVHGFGPAFELGIDFARIGPMAIEFYLETRFAWLIGNRSVSFSDNPEQRMCTSTKTDKEGVKFPTLCSTDELAGNFTTSLDQFIAQGGAGLRFTWKGNWLGDE